MIKHILGGMLLFSMHLCLAQNTIDSLDQYIPKQMKHFEVPGLGIAVVQDGKVIYSKGFGTKTINKNESVDNNTLFAIGSISKSFTPVALAMLVDEGKLHWDDKVVTYLPYFELYDPYVTQNFTIRDLLTHRSGLKDVSGGTLWYHSNFSREEIVRRLKHLKPETGYREKPAYQNTMFIVASKVVEAVIDGSWDDFIRNRIFKPLNMEGTAITQADRKKSNNITQPHIKDKAFKLIAVKQEKLDNMAPAGSFYASASDMAKYMNFMLNNGVVGKDTLVRPRTFREIITPQFHYKVSRLHNEFTSYGFGWWITPKNGNKIIDHSGGIDGMSANCLMVKNKKFGVIVLTNTSASWLASSLMYDVAGSYLKDKDYKDFTELLYDFFPKKDSIVASNRKEARGKQITNTKPSLDMAAYTGTFTDAMYGNISIIQEGDHYRITFEHTPLFTGVLKHWHFDTFEIVWDDPRVTDGLLTFEFNGKREITGFKLDQPSLLDVDFSELDIKKKN